MDKLTTLFGVPLYVVDIQGSEELAKSKSYIVDNIDTVSSCDSEFKVRQTKWTTRQSIFPYQIPEICNNIITHSEIYAEQIGIPLDYTYSYWINQWKDNGPRCTNNRHCHTKAKIIATFYVLNNEPEDATLRIENPFQNTLAFTPFNDMDGKPWWKQIVDVETYANRLVLWPGFLWHWARYTNNPDSHRISMAVEIT